MTTLALAIAGLAPGVLAALLYWAPRMFSGPCALDDSEIRAIAESVAGRVFAARMAMADASPEPHIEVLKLRAAKLSTRLYAGGCSAASRIVDDIITGGDREALLAVLREEGGGTPDAGAK